MNSPYEYFQIVKEKLKEQSAAAPAGFPGMGGMPGGMPGMDQMGAMMEQVMQNPQMRQMAESMMQNPQYQSMMQNMMGCKCVYIMKPLILS